MNVTHFRASPTLVIPAKAGTQGLPGPDAPWVPAFAGMTRVGAKER
jgi:hypothetical protein